MQNEFYRFVAGGRIKEVQRWLVNHGCRQDVSARVRVQIQKDKGLFTVFDDQVFFVVCARQGIAKDVAFFLLSIVIFHIFHAPGGPDSLHRFRILAELGQSV